MNLNEMNFLTIEKVAEILDISKQKVNALIKSGELKVLRIGPRSQRINVKDLEEYINMRIINR